MPVQGVLERQARLCNPHVELLASLTSRNILGSMYFLTALLERYTPGTRCLLYAPFAVSKTECMCWVAGVFVAPGPSAWGVWGSPGKADAAPEVITRMVF